MQNHSHGNFHPRKIQTAVLCTRLFPGGHARGRPFPPRREGQRGAPAEAPPSSARSSSGCGSHRPSSRQGGRRESPRAAAGGVATACGGRAARGGAGGGRVPRWQHDPAGGPGEVFLPAGGRARFLAGLLVLRRAAGEPTTARCFHAYENSEIPVVLAHCRWIILLLLPFFPFLSSYFYSNHGDPA
ncbi:hypothetical protein SETIT_4G126500v2 [Setaria italica]|uniref:Uncharacterized protein n=1 Tax=Setaria italica TaxID=4555 RepID=A0A368QTI5_SETIT|nr:hypothetical protein SETIT_4G126500v2 [Setaria italica]